MTKFLVIISLAGASAHGLEVIGAAALTPYAISASVTAVSGVAYVLYRWTHAATVRAYARAADEARQQISLNNPAPISTSPYDSALRRAADVERAQLRLTGIDPDKLAEVELARLVIAHADEFAAQP